jgi:membrane protein
MAAAIGYRAVFALAPLLLVAIAVAGALFGESASQGLLTEQLGQLMGERLAGDIEDILIQARDATTAGVIGFALLVWAGSGLFTEVQGSLNTINDVPPKKLQGIGQAIRQRLLTLAAVLAGGIGLVLLVGSATLAAWLPAEWASGTVAFIATVAIFFVGIVLSFRFFTPYRPPWRVVALGAIVTEVAMVIVGALVGLFVGREGAASASGIAGSVVAILLVVYFLAAVYLLGASLTRELADARPFAARASVPVDL